MKDETYLAHIVDAIDTIHEYVGDMSRNEFLDDEKTQDAVIRQFEIIGEAAKQLSEEVYEEMDTVPWQDVAKMRDRLIHGYFDVDDEIVWETIQKDLPGLLDEIERFLD